MAQPSLSQQIKKLELHLGRELFDRHAHGATLTEAGHALLPRARRILVEVHEATTNLQRELETGQGPLAVGAIPTMAPFLLPPALGRFVRDFPRCELTVREDLTGRLVAALLDYELDCAVVSTPIDSNLIELEVLGSERLLLTTSLDYRLPTSGELTLQVLRQEPTIVLHEMHCLGQQIRDFCSTHQTQQRILCRSTQLATVQELVTLGLGISILPEMAAKADRENARRYLPIQPGEPTREIAVAWRRYRSRSKLAQGLVARLKEDLQSGLHRLAPAS
ncbi:MAG: LysR family transcriptional regulator [Thermoanaerobaculia bacterium]|nr:LysR family transcriptional regulator [Thermoanaerobaculia bacterium]